MDETTLRSKAIELVEKVQTFGTKHVKSTMRQLCTMLINGPKTNVRSRHAIIRELLPTILQFHVNPNGATKSALIFFLHTLLKAKPLHFEATARALQNMAEQNPDLRVRIVTLFNYVYEDVLGAFRTRAENGRDPYPLVSPFGNGQSFWTAICTMRRIVSNFLDEDTLKTKGNDSNYTLFVQGSTRQGSTALVLGVVRAEQLVATAFSEKPAVGDGSQTSTSKTMLQDALRAAQSRRSWTVAATTKDCPTTDEDMRKEVFGAIRRLRRLLTAANVIAVSPAARLAAMKALYNLLHERPALAEAVVLPLAAYAPVLPRIGFGDRDRKRVLEGLRKILGKTLAREVPASERYRTELRDALKAMDADETYERSVATYEEAKVKAAANTALAAGGAGGVQFVKAGDTTETTTKRTERDASIDDDDAGASTNDPTPLKRRRVTTGTTPFMKSRLLPRPDASRPLPFPPPSKATLRSMERTLHKLPPSTIVDMILRNRDRLGGRPPVSTEANDDASLATAQAQLSILFESVHSLRRRIRAVDLKRAEEEEEEEERNAHAGGFVDEKARRMMSKMGWKAGEGLGLRAQGVASAIEAAATESSGAGLGFASEAKRANAAPTHLPGAAPGGGH